VTRKGVWLFVFIGVAISIFIASVVSFYADSNPDGLERVAEDHGFAENASESLNSEIFASDYLITSVSDERLSGAMAGLLGIVVTALVGFGLFALIARTKKHIHVD
jgi:cobalt/nickel transport protein